LYFVSGSVTTGVRIAGVILTNPETLAGTSSLFTTPASLLAGEEVRQPLPPADACELIHLPAEPARVLRKVAFSRLATELVHLPASWQGFDNPMTLLLSLRTVMSFSRRTCPPRSHEDAS
jgi:hypothetical protein